MKNNNDIKNYFYLITEVIKKYLENNLIVLMKNKYIEEMNKIIIMIFNLLKNNNYLNSKEYSEINLNKKWYYI